MNIYADEISNRRNLWILLYKTTHALKRIRERELQDIGTTWIQTAVLDNIVSGKEPPTPSGIARKLFRKTHTISELIRRMEKQGLVKRTRDLKRKNIIRVQITDKGERVLNESTINVEIDKIISALSPQDQESLKQILEKLWAKSMQTLSMLHNSLTL